MTTYYRKYYRVTTTFPGSDAPSKLYFDKEDKAYAYLEQAHTENGEIDHIGIITNGYAPNYSDGCTMNDLTFGDFDAKEVQLEGEGWIETRCLGDVYTDDFGHVVRTTSGDGTRTLFPYRANMVYNGYEWRQDGWNNCSGRYKPAYLARLMREGKAKWA